MALRESLARWICPDLGEQADRYKSLHGKLCDSFWWLGEFNQVTQYIGWLRDTHRDHWRKINEPPIYHGPASLGDFREQLRRQYLARRSNEKVT